MHAASILEDVLGDGRKKFVWYGEHENTMVEKGPNFAGVAACSTKDFISWKNEGIMINSINITDMVEGTAGPFKIERPRVLLNNATKKYTMWMTIDNAAGTLGMAAIAVSDYSTGPFDFVRSFYPDGNETHDQTLYQDASGDAFLIRTYYLTVDYALPAPVMQPIWEIVKNADGTINFPLSYHRANYEVGYDDFHDIYEQRWRKEDKPWEVACINKITGEKRIVPYGEVNYNGDVCNYPIERKQVTGQGSPLQKNTKGGIKSRFLDPNDLTNDVWVPDSVPAVRAQTWSNNFREGTCGMRDPNRETRGLDPRLPNRKPRDRGECSNIADNPVHGTPPDNLIGELKTVERRRAKYFAISRLTDDYLDTSGMIHTYEGEMEDEMDVIALIDSGSFGWTLGDEDGSKRSTYVDTVQSTYFATEADWETRYHQYEENYNDRSFSSISCIRDKKCPVNFRDQVTKTAVTRNEGSSF